MSDQFGKNLKEVEALKSDFRARLRDDLKAVTPEQRQKMSFDAARELSNTPEFISARTIMIFLSTPEEIDTAAIAIKAWQNAKTVVAPKISWDSIRLIPVEISSLQQSQFVVNQKNIREPISGNPVSLNEIDLVLVPGLGFASDGSRLGRGRGFYDRFLAEPELSAIFCGYAFEMQVLETLPILDHDALLSMLVTDRSVRRFSRK